MNRMPIGNLTVKAATWGFKEEQRKRYTLGIGLEVIPITSW